MTTEIDISNLDKAAVLAALYNAARPQGMGFLHYTPEPMSADNASALLAQMSSEGRRPYFDYVQGRVMKVDLSGDSLRTSLYDRDNGSGAARRALEEAGLLPSPSANETMTAPTAAQSETEA